VIGIYNEFVIASVAGGAPRDAALPRRWRALPRLDPGGVLASGGQDGGVALVGDGRGGAAAREPLLEAGGGWVERVAWSQAAGCSQ